jgi:Winged helix DNA-binding domain
MAAPSSPSAAPVLTRRALNRATLHRQLLLGRAHRTAFDTVEHLAGMQAQAPLSPHVGLWTRLHGYDPAELDALYRQRSVLRANLMRATVHLVTAEDALAWRPLTARVMLRSVNAAFGKRLVGVDRAALAAAAQELLTEAPRTSVQLGRLLSEKFPGYDPDALAYGARGHLDLVHAAPRGQWSAGSAATAHTTYAAWLGQTPDQAAAPDGMFLRYLAAFGPATVADAQAWSGLTRLNEVAERLRPHLRTFRDEDGREVFDLSQAERPDPDVPAPARFLPEYDNLLFSHADRSRVIVGGRRPPLPPGNGARAGTLLVDGMWRGVWKIIRESADTAALKVSTFGPAAKTDRDQIEQEGDRLLEFVAADASAKEVVITAEP